MKIYRSHKEIPFEKNSHITIGTFDGIHIGHQEIISKLVEGARREKARSVLVTFSPHPKTVVKLKKEPIKLLTPLEEKIDILNDLKLETLLILPFTDKISEMDPEVFLHEILVNGMGLSHIIIGFNHAFGRQRKGNVDLLKSLEKKYKYTVDLLEPVYIGHTVVSSTQIRRFIQKGNIASANQMLGRHYTLFGTVKKGNRIGSQIGFPTANLEIQGEMKCIPGDGVYAVFAHVNKKKYIGTANLGFRPTMNGSKREIEVHLHQYSGDLYNQKIHFEFIEKIRAERRFDTVQHLTEQIQQDQIKSEKILAKITRRK